MRLNRLLQICAACFGIALRATVTPCSLDAQVARAQSRTAVTEPHAPRLTVEPKRPTEGSLVRLTIDQLPLEGDSVISVEGELAGEPLHFLRAIDGRRLALGAIPVEASDSVVAQVLLARESGVIDTLHVALKYPHRPPSNSAAAIAKRKSGPRLRVDTRFTKRMDAKTEQRVEHENELARDVGRQSQETPRLWTLPFLRPRDSKVTSRFGTGRVFNGKLSSNHLGVDYRGSLGEPIFAANRGVVALVAEFFLAGNVVYLNHGDGLVTGYFHMSQPEVAVGDTVERGQEIGRVGATGRVTGPHLHWSARFGTLTVNPGDLLKLASPFVSADTLHRTARR